MTSLMHVLVVLCCGTSVMAQSKTDALPCDSNIYCNGPLLDAVQRSRLFEDSKHFVDMSMKSDPDDILEKFHKLQLSSSDKPGQYEMLRDFVEENFNPPGEELIEYAPDDWVEKPLLLKRIVDSDLQSWAKELNEVWKILGRKVKDEVWLNQQRYSLIYLQNPVVIPGDRFREVYYWDSYWIVNGLLLCEMHETARGMIENLISLVKLYGHVPNGGRVYYTNRSQPPLLLWMVDSYFSHTKDLDFVKDNIEYLEKEYEFWINNRTVSITDSSNVQHKLARYKVEVDKPRPEGYLEDIELVEDLKFDSSKSAYQEIASACESGWDFSTRWFADNETIKTIHTSDIIPVDLNVFLQVNEDILSRFYKLLGNTEKEDTYKNDAKARFNSINSLMWNESEGSWFDYDISLKKQQTRFYPSNVFPLLMKGWTNEDQLKRAENIMAYLDSTKVDIFSYRGGVPTSLINSGQQWDLPNAWAPLVHLFVEALDSCRLPAAKEAAFNVSKNWISNNWIAWDMHRKMFEKYNAENPGAAGGGGEYHVQTGFGWSNGVVFMFMNKYPETMVILANQPGGFSTSLIVCLIFVGILLILALLGLIAHARRKYQMQRKLPMSSAFAISEHSNAVYHPVTEPISRSNSEVQYR